MRLDNPLLVRWEFASEERLAKRNAIARRLARGENAEEWAFRVLLQGWLERLMTHTGNPFHLLVGGIAPAESMVLDESGQPQRTE